MNLNFGKKRYSALSPSSSCEPGFLFEVSLEPPGLREPWEPRPESDPRPLPPELSR